MPFKTRTVKAVVTAALTAAALVVPLGASYASANQGDQGPGQDLGQLLEDATPTLAAVYIDLANAEAQMEAAQKAVDDAMAQHAEAMREHAELSDALKSAESELDRLRPKIDSADASIDATKKALGYMARDAMSGAGMTDPGLAVTVGGQPLETALAKHMAREAVAASRGATLKQSQAVSGAGRYAQARLEAVAAEAARLTEQAEEALDKAAAAQKEAEAAKAKLEELVESMTALSQRLEAEKTADLARQRELEAEAQALQAELAQFYANQSLLPGHVLGDGFFLNPLPGAPMTSPFGPRVHPIYGDVRFHAGVDYGAACGVPVLATAAGTVVQSKSTQGYGNRVVLSHGSVSGTVMMSTYNHLQGLDVKVGDNLARGGVVGRVGTTGASTGCHLHFEIQRGGDVVDPMTYLTGSR